MPFAIQDTPQQRPNYTPEEMGGKKSDAKTKKDFDDAQKKAGEEIKSQPNSKSQSAGQVSSASPSTTPPKLDLPIRRWFGKVSSLPMHRATMINITNVWQGPKEPGIYLDQENNLAVYVDPNGTVVCSDVVTAADESNKLTEETYINDIQIDPRWVPPDDIREELRAAGKNPNDREGGASNNPKGMAHLALAGGLKRFHGTNEPGLIGEINRERVRNKLAGNPKAKYSHGCGRWKNCEIFVLAYVIPNRCRVTPYVMDETQLRAIHDIPNKQKRADRLAVEKLANSIKNREIARIEVRKAREAEKTADDVKNNSEAPLPSSSQPNPPATSEPAPQPEPRAPIKPDDKKQPLPKEPPPPVPPKIALPVPLPPVELNPKPPQV